MNHRVHCHGGGLGLVLFLLPAICTAYHAVCVSYQYKHGREEILNGSKGNKYACQVQIERTAICRHVDTDRKSGARSHPGLPLQKGPEHWVCDDQRFEALPPIARAELSPGRPRHARSFASTAVRAETNGRHGCVSEKTQGANLPISALYTGK